jgi:signal transduction histidine kinase
MKSTAKNVKNLLRSEVAAKGIPAAMTFGIFAVVIFFYHFNVEHYLFWIRSSCVVVLISSILRFYFSKKMVQDNDQDDCWLHLRLTIWLTAVAWGIIFCLTTIELKTFGVDYAIMMLILSGFTSSSLATIAYDKMLFFPFQILLLVPVMVVGAYHGVQTGEHGYYVMSLFLLVAMLYQLKQFGTFKDALIGQFTYRLELEGSYHALKESQDALIAQTVKLIQASKVSALGDMAGGLSHEVNNSLMVILGSIQQLERNIRSDHGKNPAYENKILMARNAINKIKSVVDGLKFFSQQMEKAPKENVSLEEIIQRTLNFCFEIIKANAIRLDVDKIPSVELNCQPIQITQICFNLLKNAFDALEKSTNPEHKWIRISFIPRLDELYVIVSNGGPKISDAAAAKVFQPFFTTKDVGKGTGLSLSISKGIAREHFGDLNLDEEKENTTFVLNLPIQKFISQNTES